MSGGGFINFPLLLGFGVFDGLLDIRRHSGFLERFMREDSVNWDDYVGLACANSERPGSPAFPVCWGMPDLRCLIDTQGTQPVGNKK